LVKRIIVIILILLLVPVSIYFVFPEVLYNIGIALERKSAGLSLKSVEAGNHTINYLEGGDGATILLLHGFSGEKDNWTRFSKSITSKYHVVAIDLPGFGESSKIDTESYTIATQLKLLDRIVNTLKLDKFHLVGNSMGGFIAGRYAAKVPDKVLSLALFDTLGIQSLKKSELFKLLEKGENPLLVKTYEDFELLIGFIFVDPPFIPKPVMKYLAKRAIMSRDFNEKIINDLIEEKDSLEPYLPKIGVKSLILWGDMDRLLDLSCTKALEKGLKKHETVIMKNCGHCPMLERPKETASHYLEFLKGV